MSPPKENLFPLANHVMLGGKLPMPPCWQGDCLAIASNQMPPNVGHGQRGQMRLFALLQWLVGPASGKQWSIPRSICHPLIRVVRFDRRLAFAGQNWVQDPQ